MSKINYNAKSKLSNTEAPVEKPKQSLEIPDKILMSTHQKSRVTSFSLRPNDQNRFNFLLKKVQHQMHKKITVTDILRGLLLFGEKTDISELTESVKKTFLE
jgi:ferritin